jgi:hypothetical protein
MRAMSRRETLAFFRRYRTAFNRLDGDAVADLWHTPSSIADSAADGTHARVTHCAAPTACACWQPRRTRRIRQMKGRNHAAE